MLKLTNVWPDRKARRTTLIAFFCAAALVGLALAKIGWQASAWQAAGAAALTAFCWRRKAGVAVIVVVGMGMLCGLWRGEDVQQELALYRPYLGTKVSITGMVVDDPTYGDKGQQDFRVTNIRLDGRGPPGSLRVTSFSPIEPRRGDVIRASGKLYDGFGNYQAALYFADISVVRVNTNIVESLRRHFAASVYSNMPDPQASLGLGFLVGIKSQLPTALSDQLKLLGLTHIVVASGYNLTVLVRVSRRLFARRSKYQAALVAAILMAGFVAVTGFSPSMSRAALVSSLSLAAWYYGRHIHPVVLLLFAAAVTAGIDPLLLWGDIGWWLSFLAFAGVLILSPLLQRRVFGHRQPKLIGQLVIETLSAQLLTLPLMLAIFGNVSILSLLANVLVVPLIPLAMLLTFVGGVAGLGLGALAAYLALPATWLLGYITQIVAALAGVRWAAFTYTIDTPVMIGCYVALALVGLLLWHVTRHDFLATNVVE